MGYINFSDFSRIYGDALTQTEFERISYEAERYLDAFTTGVDNVRKLRIAFPTDEADAMAVKRCCCALVKALKDIESVSLDVTPNGVTSGVIASVSSGSESISYKTDTGLMLAVTSESARNGYLYNIAKHYLSGVTDANGVNLLYGGSYV